jgi:hypothetical protein
LGLREVSGQALIEGGDVGQGGSAEALHPLVDSARPIESVQCGVRTARVAGNTALCRARRLPASAQQALTNGWRDWKVGRLVAESEAGTARLHAFDKGCSPSRQTSNSQTINAAVGARGTRE